MEPKKPDWMIQAEQDLEAWKETPLFKYTDGQLQSLALAYQCPSCKKAFSSVHYPPHIKVCEEMQQRKKEIIELYDQGLTSVEIAKKIGISKSKVGVVLDECALTPHTTLNTIKLQKDCNDLYESGITSYAEIARILNINIVTVSKVLRRDEDKVADFVTHTNTKDEIIMTIYHNGSRPSNAEIARESGYDFATVSDTLRKLGLVSWSKIRKAENQIHIIKLFLEGGKTQQQIADIVGENRVTVSYAIRDYKQGKIQYNP